MIRKLSVYAVGRIAEKLRNPAATLILICLLDPTCGFSLEDGLGIESEDRGEAVSLLIGLGLASYQDTMVGSADSIFGPEPLYDSRLELNTENFEKMFGTV